MTTSQARSLIAGFGLALVVGSLLGGCRRDTRPSPNIVLVIIDDLRADYLRAQDVPDELSEEVTRLVSRGVHFESVLTPCTWTRPATGSLLTSKHPRSLGLYDERNESLPSGVDTLPEVLRRAGYRTVGLTANPNINSTYGFAQGFDVYVDSDVIFSWMPVQSGGKRATVGPSQLPTARSILDRAQSLASEHLKQPLYLQVNLMEVHEYNRRRWEPDRAVASATLEAHYAAAVKEVVAEINAFLDRWTEVRSERDTIVVVTSDHGETLDEHSALADPKWHGFLVYSSQAFVPVVMFSAGDLLPRGRVIDVRISLLDVMPTLLEIVGVEGPDGMNGRSLAPVIEDSTEVLYEVPLFVETEFRTAEKVAVYFGTWSYIENRDDHSGTSPVELQWFGKEENGQETDQSARFPAATSALARLLHDWETRYPRRDITPTQEPTDREESQLRAIGYLD